MKKAILIISAILLISEGSVCQWYQKQYGVNDLNLLTIEQLNEALTKSRTGLVFGAVLTIPATIGIMTGLIMMNTDYPEPNAKPFEGMAYMIFSIFPEIAGLTLLGVYSSRMKKIKEIMKNTEIKIGLLNYPAKRILADPTGSYLPVLSITFRF